MTHDFKRQGTTTLFAAFHVLDGQVIGECLPRHRHQEFLKFLRQIDRETPPALELHLIVDNYSTHKHEQVKKWLAKRSSPLSGQLRHKISSPKSSAPPKSTPLSRTVSGTTLARCRQGACPPWQSHDSLFVQVFKVPNFFLKKADTYR